MNNIDEEKHHLSKSPSPHENEQQWLNGYSITDEEISNLKRLHDLDWDAFKRFISDPKNSEPIKDSTKRRIPYVAEVRDMRLGIDSIASLAPGQMVIDKALNLGFTMLEQDLKHQMASQDNSALNVRPEDIHFVPTSISMAIGQSQSFDIPNLDQAEEDPAKREELRHALEAIELEAMKKELITPEMEKAKLLFIPVNDKTINRSQDARNNTSQHGGGSHWEFLCMRKDELGNWTSHYYDTLNRGDISGRGKAIERKFQALLSKPGKTIRPDTFTVHRAPSLTENNCGVLSIGVARVIGEQFIKDPNAIPGDIVKVRSPAQERKAIASVALQAASCHRAFPSLDEPKHLPAIEAELIDPELNIPVKDRIQAQQLHEEIEEKKVHKEIQTALGLNDDQLKELIEQEKSFWHNHEMKKEASKRYAKDESKVLRGFELYAETMTKLNRKADFADFERVSPKALERIPKTNDGKKYEKAYQQFIEDDLQDQALIEQYKDLMTLKDKGKEDAKKILINLANALDPCIDKNTFQRRKVRSLTDENIEFVDKPNKNVGGSKILLFVDKELGYAYFKKTGAIQRNLRLAVVPLSRINQETHSLTAGKKYDQSVLSEQSTLSVQPAMPKIKAH